MNRNARRRASIARQAQAKRRANIVNSGYSEGGASYVKKSLKGFVSQSLSPQKDIDENLRTLSSRSRVLYQTAPIATSAVKSIKTNVVGGGLKLKPRIDYEFLGMTKEKADKWERNVEREFNLWAESTLCDALNINNFYEMQGLILQGQILNGDGFCLRKYEKPTMFMPYGLRLQLIESDRICTPSSAGVGSIGIWGIADNQNRIYNGVEIDDNGKAVAYHVCNQYPYSQNLFNKQPMAWQRVPIYGEKSGMKQIIHLFDAERPEQYRGVPLLSPVIESLKQITRYTEAELMAAVISGMFTVFIKSESPKNELNFGEIIPSEVGDVSEDENEYEMGVGAINVLGENESIEIADPKRPIAGFDNFVNALAKQIGAAIEIPFELLMKEFNSSYSASRAALLEAWKMFRTRRETLVRGFCQPVYEMFLIEAVANGRVKAKGFFEDPVKMKAWCSASWNGAVQGLIDPIKETQASILRINNGLSTREEETIALNGGDFNANIIKLEAENKKFAESQKVIEEMKSKNAFQKGQQAQAEQKDEKKPRKKSKVKEVEKEDDSKDE